MKNIVQYILFVCLSFLLASCSGERCIEADDFGHSTLTIPARYNQSDISSPGGAEQVTPWIDSTFTVNVRPLTVVVNGWDYGVEKNSPEELSAWCPWYGRNSDGSKLSRICERLQECRFRDDQMCTTGQNAEIINFPCILTKGVGLYALVTTRDYDPNKYVSSKRNPSGVNFHVGALRGSFTASDNGGNSSYDFYGTDKNGNTRVLGGRVYSFSEADQAKYDNGKLYFKILDRFYDDNSGQYKVVIKSGVNRSSPDPISYVTKLVKDFLFGANENDGIIKKIYLGIVGNSGYQYAVSALLTLYIIYTALSYLSGNMQLTHTELLVRVGKIAVISALLKAEYSWNFFNNYLFVFFVGGVEQILQMIVDAGATGPGSPTILALMIAPQTLSKLFSLLFVSGLGFIYIIMYIIVLYFVLMIFFKAAVIYLTALMTIGLIIAVGPIFICFLLFDATKSLFENWLKQLISYAIQPIILFTGLIFISVILRSEIYSTLGFRVCKFDLFKLNNGQSVLSSKTQSELEFGNAIFYWWFPNPMKGENFSRNKVVIPIPMDHFAEQPDTVVGHVSSSGITSGVTTANNNFCEAYQCLGRRYADLPFLTPESSANVKDNDQKRIDSFWSGKFIYIDSLFLIFAAIYLLSKFNDFAVGIAKFISGGWGRTEISSVGGGIQAQTFGRLNPAMAETVAGVGFKRDEKGRKIGLTSDRHKGRQRIETAKHAPAELAKTAAKGLVSLPTMAVSKWRGKDMSIEARRVRALKKEALAMLGSPIVKATGVLNEVQKKTGIDAKTVDKDAIKKYRQALRDIAVKNRKIENNTEAARNLDAVIKKMSRKDYAKMDQELAKLMYGKSYDNLDAKEKKDVDALYKDPKLRRLSLEAKKTEKFQDAYVEAHIALSERGVGRFGKRSRILRSIEETKYEAEEREKIEEQKRVQRGEQFISGVEKLKHGAYSALGGKPGGMSLEYGGGGYHEIDTNPDGDNYLMQTEAEKLERNKSKVAAAENRQEVRKLSNKVGSDISSPEFLAKARQEGDGRVSRFKQLSDVDLHYEVREALMEGDDPALRGETYLSKYAKDSEMSDMIDRVYEVEKDLMQNDRYISMEDDYQARLDLSVDVIREACETLDIDPEYDDVPLEELPRLLEEHRQQEREQQGLKPDYGASREEVDNLSKSVQEFESSQLALQEIDKRKVQISAEIDSYVDHINHHRVENHMPEYKPSHESTREVRKFKGIDDYLRD